MYKFTKKEVGEDKVKHVVDAEYSTWMEMVAEFQIFLEKCGYLFPKDFDMCSILYNALREPYEKKSKKIGGNR